MCYIDYWYYTCGHKHLERRVNRCRKAKAHQECMKIPFHNTIERHCNTCQERQLRGEQYQREKQAEKQRQEEVENEKENEIEGESGD